MFEKFYMISSKSRNQELRDLITIVVSQLN
jgi:hypothetical protein